MMRLPWATAALAAAAHLAAAQASNLSKSPRELCSTFDRPGVSSVAGVVRENTGAPIPFATVTFDGGYTTTGLADRNGCFVVKSPRNAQLTVNVRRIGFQPFSQALNLTGDSTVFLDVRLSSVASQISGVQVTAPRNDAMERTGFYDRMLEREKGVGDGYYVTPEDIERRGEDKVTHLIEGFPNIFVRYDGYGNGYPEARGHSDPTAGHNLPNFPSDPKTNAAATSGGMCVMAIWVDGAHIPTGSVTDKGGSLDEIVGSRAIAAIEVYPTAMQTPPQFQTSAADGACGAVVVWTQHPDFTRNRGNWFKENLLTIIVVPLLLIAVISTIGKAP